MSRISDLIERLRAQASMLDENDGLVVQALKSSLIESADVIEELSTKLQSANMQRSSQYYNGGWIPVSERLPEKNGEYLITGRQGVVNKRRYHDGHWYGNWSVLAWMPLPQPYKAESEVGE